MKTQICCRCVMDNVSDTSISFDDQGYCNYCRDTLKRMPKEYFPNEEGKKKLDSIMSQIKSTCKDDSYDCIVGVSGGIDSSYILYLGYQYQLRMMAVHLDDGFDNPVAVQNLEKLCQKTNTELVVIKPDAEQYRDIVKSLFKASISDPAIAQDNLIITALHQYAKQHHIKYMLNGANFAHECILERGDGVNACDKRFIKGIHKRFGEGKIDKMHFTSLFEKYVLYKYSSPVTKVTPLNYIDYNLEKAIQTLHDFCGFEYYGGKHNECILTRFLQCYYLPVKFSQDKRKSHLSSLIVSGQITREEALKRLEQPLYPSQEMLESDKKWIADFLCISVDELESYIALPPKSYGEYPRSMLNHLAPLARKFRRFLG